MTAIVRAASACLLAHTMACADRAAPATGACPTGGAGQLRVDVAGLPADLRPDLVLAGVDGAAPIDAAAPIDLPTGEYRLTAGLVAAPDAVVRTAYAADARDTILCVGDGRLTTARVGYDPIATSGKLWAPDADVVAGSIAFDRRGDLWVLGDGDGPALRGYGAARVARAGRDADIAIELAPRWRCPRGATGLAFAPDGGLWLSVGCADAVVRLAPADLAASGEVTPAVEIRGIPSPQGLAFDARGDLWIAAGTIHAVDAARLVSSTEGASQVLSIAATGEARPARAHHLAFDAGGDLWATVEANYQLARIQRADLPGRGARPVAPIAHVSVGAHARPRTVAFDESGDLWLAVGGGAVAVLDRQQQRDETTDAQPTIAMRVIARPALTDAGDIAFFPAAAALPLHHRLP